jgi:hypothetical protein
VRTPTTWKALLALATLGGCLGLVISLSLSASASTQRGNANSALRAAAGHTHRHGTRHAVTVGSTWTLYDYQRGPKTHAFCEIFTFAADGAFSGDAGNVGKWTSTNRVTTLIFTDNVTLPRGKFTGKAMFDGQYAGTAVQKGASGGKYGPLTLVSGSDPFGEGGC